MLRDADALLVKARSVVPDAAGLVLAVYATVKRTDLFVRQAAGRVVRRRTGDLVATVFLPSGPTLTGCAERA